MLHPITSGVPVAPAPLEPKPSAGPVAQLPIAAGDTVTISAKGHHAAAPSGDADHDGDGH